MLTSRRWRRGIASWLMLALLFMQGATAAHACPGAAAMMSMAAMPDCEGHAPADTPNAPLCKAHCEQGLQNVGAVSTADLPPAGLLLAVLDWRLAALPAASPASPGARPPAGPAPPGTAPVYLRFQVLRN